MDDQDETSVTDEAPAKSKKARKARGKVKKPAKRARAATNGGGKSVVDTEKYQYEKADAKTAGGRRCVDNADRVASMLRGKSIDDIRAIFKANKLEFRSNWDDLNPGLVRMSAGNVLRGLVRKGTSIKIDNKSVASLGS